MSKSDLASETLSSFRQGAGVSGGALPEWCDADKPMFHIDAEGRWQYLESPLPVKFARLFSSILKCVDGVYQLVTPVERVLVEVELYPLILVDYDKQGSQFKVMTSLGTEFIVEEQAISCLDENIICSLPDGLSARFNRASYYRFINDFVLGES
ncbi:DUF1285 domain-containing protein [Shewanella submarina]|uniref:DUF1285 domain-containing protein n=1 Tax=Shewanella submarina TaxID=2016376 RepID=A0ABV7GEI9_9GAMM|nr:DUF1285 domain-containing protein [Shewanella submarina]MCL1037566.1 DUF1285 domain-containing protein [Shewanella submarina]